MDRKSLRTVAPAYRPGYNSWTQFWTDHSNQDQDEWFLEPVRFLALKAKSSTRRNFTTVLFSWSHQAAHPIRLGMALHLWFDQIIHRTTHGLQLSCRPRTGISNVLHILWDPYEPVWDPQGCRMASLQTRKRIDTTRFGKIPHVVVCCHTGHVQVFVVPTWAVHYI